MLSLWFPQFFQGRNLENRRPDKCAGGPGNFFEILPLKHLILCSVLCKIKLVEFRLLWDDTGSTIPKNKNPAMN